MYLFLKFRLFILSVKLTGVSELVTNLLPLDVLGYFQKLLILENGMLPGASMGSIISIRSISLMDCGAFHLMGRLYFYNRTAPYLLFV